MKELFRRSPILAAALRKGGGLEVSTVALKSKCLGFYSCHHPILIHWRSLQ